MNPFDSNKRIALIAGIAFFGLGLLMMILGIQAEGAIDFQSEFLTGKIKTGSAGLFVAFFSFLIIIFSIIRSTRINRYDNGPHRNAPPLVYRVGIIAIVVTSILLAIVILISVFAEVPEGFGGGLLFAGFGLGLTLFMAIVATIASLEDGRRDKR